MPNDPVATAKKAIAALPTFDKVQVVKRILTNNLPDNRFTDENIKEMIIRFKRYNDAVSKLIESSGGEWSREDVTEEVVAKVTEEITTMIDEMTETQYRLFIENSIKRLKVNDFYR
jgi:predicted Zn-dependent protease